MTVTVLASVFLLLILLLAFAGFKAATKEVKPAEDRNTETCSVCRQKYNKAVLLERQIGDYKILYFCPTCIGSLHSEMTSKN